MYTLRPTKKLATRIGGTPAETLADHTNTLGDWYANALFWRPQVALLVSARTLFPVLMPLAPAATLAARFPDALGETLMAAGVHPWFAAREVKSMERVQFGRTESRSTLGVMVEMGRHAGYRRDWPTLVHIAVELSHMPCRPLMADYLRPIDAVHGLVDGAAWMS